MVNLDNYADEDVRLTSSPTIKNAPLPAEGPGSFDFSNTLLIGILLAVPLFFTRLLGLGFKTYCFFFIVSAIPILMGYWLLFSSSGTRLDERIAIPMRPIEEYLEFKDKELKQKYSGYIKIPLETFQELYIEGKVDCVNDKDLLDVLEHRHVWASFRFTMNLFKFFLFKMIPEVILHSRSQDEEQVRDHYDRGDDFYRAFLGERMIYTSGIISDINKTESLEQLQDNKLKVVCEKIELKPSQRLLDIGCGWGTLAAYATKNYQAEVTGITLGRNQTRYGNKAIEEAVGSKSKSRILCMDYRDIPVPEGKYNKITCLEMAEHVGIRKFQSFLRQVYDMLDDDGLFFLQIAGLRKSWQYEDLIWGLFMNKYIFPGADASTPLGWFIDQLEKAGFEVKTVDTIGVHYSATIWRWYQNWLQNKENIEQKYGQRWYRIWRLFLAWSTIVSRQGGATCYQIVLHKNKNAFHRINGVPSQQGIQAILKK